jgi:hypothetical protein
VTDFYEYGWGQSFHFCRFHKGESFDKAIARHEHYLAAKLGLRPGMEVLVGLVPLLVISLTFCRILAAVLVCLR